VTAVRRPRRSATELAAPGAARAALQILTIAGRDLRTTYLSPFGIGATAGFVALSGGVLVLDLNPGVARLDAWFASLFVLIGLLAALVTMRSFAEEERSGSLELLITAPVSIAQVVLGKLLGALAVLLVVTSASAVCPLVISTMAHPDSGPIITGYVGLLLVGAAFVSVGLAVSACTANPLVAATGTAATLVGLWFGGLVGGGMTGRPRAVLDYLSPATHVTGFLRGTLGATDVVYFLSLILIGTMCAAAVVERRR
jgi:ABC-2 type transport system permease protein